MPREPASFIIGSTEEEDCDSDASSETILGGQIVDMDVWEGRKPTPRFPTPPPRRLRKHKHTSPEPEPAKKPERKPEAKAASRSGGQNKVIAKNWIHIGDMAVYFEAEKEIDERIFRMQEMTRYEEEVEEIEKMRGWMMAEAMARRGAEEYPVETIESVAKQIPPSLSRPKKPQKPKRRVEGGTWY
ncbi:hypothetical protein K402DRAFT_388163 [Aulographum hederae CBS 113979]|uniref:Uncharacterized protein n=1 Tax=Aulographum hederae CBS 113979 TaxID=1176131 RepID=A0A6G1HHU0_9PEZI|nr:hypothetical protein K402DRAFT_388163 [Aulographum hederae CBS 113979]